MTNGIDLRPCPLQCNERAKRNRQDRWKWWISWKDVSAGSAKVLLHCASCRWSRRLVPQAQIVEAEAFGISDPHFACTICKSKQVLQDLFVNLFRRQQGLLAGLPSLRMSTVYNWDCHCLSRPPGEEEKISHKSQKFPAIKIYYKKTKAFNVETSNKCLPFWLRFS